MSFTLTDPRALALSQAGGNFGQGLGSELIGMLENQRFQNALQGGNPNDPYAMLQRFAQNRVSPQMQSQFFDPIVQQRIANQDALKQLREGLNGAKSPEDLAFLLAQAQVAQGKDFDMKSIVDLYRGGQLSKEFDNPNVPNQGSNTSPMQPGVSPHQQFPGVGKVDNTQASNNIIAKPGLVGDLPAPVSVPLLSQPEINKMRKEYYKKYGREDGEKMVKQRIADNNREYTNATTTRNQAVNENEQFLNRQDRAKNFVGQRIAAKYQGNPNYLPVFTEMAKDLTGKEYKNSEESAYAEVDAKYIDPLMQRIDAVEKKLPQSDLVFKSLDNPDKQKLLRNVNADLDAIIKEVPEPYRKEVRDQLRQRLAQKNGLGVVGADWALSPPSEKIKARMNEIGPAPKERVLQAGGGGFGLVPNKAYPKQLQVAEKKLVSLLKAELPRVPATILKDLWVTGLGWSDQSFDDAMAEAIRQGVKIPAQLESAYNDAKLKQNPSLLEYGLGEGLRKPGEFFR